MMATAEEATTIDPGPFGIDTPDHSDRDREMFVLGFEYAEIQGKLRSRPREAWRMTIHAANARRAERLAANFGREHHTIRTADNPEWCELIVYRTD